MKVCVVGSDMKGNVPHHSGHYTGRDSDGNKIYCNGHKVSGSANDANQSKLYIQGKLALVDGATGPSNDQCDGSDFKVSASGSNIYIQGKKAVLKGNSVSLSPGSGKMTNANQSKLNN